MAKVNPPRNFEIDLSFEERFKLHTLVSSAEPETRKDLQRFSAAADILAGDEHFESEPGMSNEDLAVLNAQNNAKIAAGETTALLMAREDATAVLDAVDAVLKNTKLVGPAKRTGYLKGLTVALEALEAAKGGEKHVRVRPVTLKAAPADVEAGADGASAQPAT